MQSIVRRRAWRNCSGVFGRGPRARAQTLAARSLWTQRRRARSPAIDKCMAGLRVTLYAPGGIRTHDLRLRRPTLYPAELLAQTAGRVDGETGRRVGLLSPALQEPLAVWNLPPVCLVTLRLVGASGFEPPTSWSRTRRANRAALRPENLDGQTARRVDGEGDRSRPDPPVSPAHRLPVFCLCPR